MVCRPVRKRCAVAAPVHALAAKPPQALVEGFSVSARITRIACIAMFKEQLSSLHGALLLIVATRSTCSLMTPPALATIEVSMLGTRQILLGSAISLRRLPPGAKASNAFATLFSWLLQRPYQHRSQCSAAFKARGSIRVGRSRPQPQSWPSQRHSAHKSPPQASASLTDVCRMQYEHNKIHRSSTSWHCACRGPL